MDLKIVIIGVGRLGKHLTRQLWHQGATIVQLFNRSDSENLRKVSFDCDIPYTTDFRYLYKTADIYILCVPDAVIAPISNQLTEIITDDACIIHCSGATSLRQISDKHPHAAVLWPIFSFGPDIEIMWNELTVAYDYNSAKSEVCIRRLLEILKSKHLHSDDQQRSILHLAAVIGSNFSTALYSLAYDLCLENNLSFQALTPLFVQNTQKLLRSVKDPFTKITGPAIRNDRSTMDQHIYQLEDPLSKGIYKDLSNWIHRKRDRVE